MSEAPDGGHDSRSDEDQRVESSPPAPDGAAYSWYRPGLELIGPAGARPAASAITGPAGTGPAMAGDGTASAPRGCAEALASAYDVALLDLDGVVYIGASAVAGAADSLAKARAADLRVAFVT